MKRKSDGKTKEIPDEDREEPSKSEKSSDIEGGSSDHKRMKSKQDTQTSDEKVSKLAKTETPHSIYPIPVYSSDDNLDCSIEKYTMRDEPSTSPDVSISKAPDQILGLKTSSTIDMKAPYKITPVCEKLDCLDNSIKKYTMGESLPRKITKRRNALLDQTIDQKTSSLVDHDYCKFRFPDPKQFSTSGENPVFSKKLTDSEKTRQSVVDAKKKIQSINPYRFLTLSQDEERIFDEESLNTTLKVMTNLIKKNVKSFFEDYLTSTHNTRSCLSNARKLDKSLEKINNIIWEIPKLYLEDNTSCEIKNLSDIIVYLSGGHLANIGEGFNFNKIDKPKFMEKYKLFVDKWDTDVEHFNSQGDDVHKKIEQLLITVKEAIKKCDGGIQFVNRLKNSSSLMRIAVLQRSHQIGEDITRPPHVSYNVSDHYFEKVKESYLNPTQCTDELHALHSQISSYDFDKFTSQDKSPNDKSQEQYCLPQNSLGNFDDAERIFTEYLQEANREMEPLEQGCQPQNILRNFDDAEKIFGEFLQEDSSETKPLEKDLQPQNSLRNFDYADKICREFIQKDTSEITNFQGKGLSTLELNPNASKIQLGQLVLGRMMGSSDVKQNPTNPTGKLIKSMDTASIKGTSTDTSQSLFQLIPSTSTKGIESSSTEHQHIVEQRPTNYEQFHPLSCIYDQQSSTDNSQTKMLSKPETLTLTSATLQKHEAYVDSKDQIKYEDRISTDTTNYEDLYLNSPVFQKNRESNELVEQKTAIENPELNPIKILHNEFSNPSSPQNQITSTPVKRENDKCIDSREFQDLLSETETIEDFLIETESTEYSKVSSSSDSNYQVCDKSIELDEIHDQLWLIAYEIEEFTKNLENLLEETHAAVKELVNSKATFLQNVQKFLKMEIPGLV